MKDQTRASIQMKAADLSEKICALRQSIMQLLNHTPDHKRQKALFGMNLLMGKLEQDATRIANGLDITNDD